MALSPNVYARLLGERIAKHRTDVWMINTGWTGGPYGEGNRMEIAHTRAMISAVFKGDLHAMPTRTDKVFGLEVPVHCPGVPDEVLHPRQTWQNAGRYDEQAARLAAMFHANFRQFEDEVDAEVAAAGPTI